MLLLPLALVMLTPLVWMVITGVSTHAEARSFPPSLPTGGVDRNVVKNFGDVLDDWRRSAAGC